MLVVLRLEQLERVVELRSLPLVWGVSCSGCHSDCDSELFF